MIVKDLLIDIIDLISLYQLDDIEVTSHQLFTFLKQFVLLFRFDILERVAFTETIAAKTASTEALDNSINHVFVVVGPKVSKLATIHDEHVEEIELLAVRPLANSKFIGVDTFLDKLFHFVSWQVYIFFFYATGTLTVNCFLSLWERC